MIVAALFAVAAFVLGGAIVAIRYRRQTPAELRGDWWTGFEREFWEYERRTAADRRPRFPGRPAPRRDRRRPTPPRRRRVARPRLDGFED